MSGKNATLLNSPLAMNFDFRVHGHISALRTIANFPSAALVTLTRYPVFEALLFAHVLLTAGGLSSI